MCCLPVQQSQVILYWQNTLQILWQGCRNVPHENGSVASITVTSQFDCQLSAVRLSCGCCSFCFFPACLSVHLATLIVCWLLSSAHSSMCSCSVDFMVRCNVVIMLANRLVVILWWLRIWWPKPRSLTRWLWCIHCRESMKSGCSRRSSHRWHDISLHVYCLFNFTLCYTMLDGA